MAAPRERSDFRDRVGRIAERDPDRNKPKKKRGRPLGEKILGILALGLVIFFARTFGGEIMEATGAEGLAAAALAPQAGAPSSPGTAPAAAGQPAAGASGGTQAAGGFGAWLAAALGQAGAAPAGGTGAPAGVEASLTGPVVAAPRVLTEDGTTLTLREIATDLVRADRPWPPERVSLFAPNTACTLRTPRPGERVVGVTLDRALGSAQLAAFSDADIGRFSDPLDADLGTVDVFVTDRSAPLYLVLQTASRGAIWNLIAAEGVRIAHVALISEGSSGVRGLPGGAGVEAIRAADFVAPDGTAADGCDVRPWRLPAEDWIATGRAGTGDPTANDIVERHTMGHLAYNAWHHGALGVPAAQAQIQAAGAQMVMVGPRQTGRIPYVPLTDGTIRLARADHLFTGPTDFRKARIEALLSRTD